MATAKKTPAAKTTKTTKPAGTSVTIANVPLPANYEETRADRMAAFKSRLQVTESNKIQVTQDKHFKLPNADGESEKTDTIAGIIVDFASRKAFYETAFDRDNPVPPNCFAIGFASFDELPRRRTRPSASPKAAVAPAPSTSSRSSRTASGRPRTARTAIASRCWPRTAPATAS